MKLIVGLGNPGLRYKNTKHNLGFLVIDALSKKFEIKLNKKRFNAIFGRGNINNQSVILAKPLTFMNNSGQAVKALMNRFNIELDDLIIICDDFNLDLGNIRIRKRGSSGGHNGLTSVIEDLGTKDFLRLRVGIGTPPLRGDPAVYVLKKFTRNGKAVIKNMIPLSCDAINTIVSEGVEAGMNKYNRKHT